MPALLPHPSRALQRTLALSVLVHVVAVIGLRAGTPPAARAEVPQASAAAVPVDVEIAEADDADDAAQVAAQVAEGREDHAQGDASPAPEPAREPASEPEPAAKPEPPAPPPPPRMETKQEGELEPEPEARPVPPPRPVTPREASPPVPAAAPPMPRSTPATPAAPAAPATPATAASSTGAVAGEPGDGGGFSRPRARDLAAAITSALPPASDSMAAWRTLPLGDAGRVEVELHTDGEGRLTAEVVFVPATPAAHLVEMLSRTRLRTGRAPAALDASGPGAGTLRLRLAVRIDEVAVPKDVPGGAFGLHAAFRNGRGVAHFTLAEGRRVTIEVEVVRVSRTR